ncbi:MAG TPA: phage holin family protein [Rhodothermales bacterium]|nr:phage holin family protein [Rhodothermales bacterium]
MPENTEGSGTDLATRPRPVQKVQKAPDGRIDRLITETRQLGDDLTQWVNLRLKLVQLDIQERIDEELDFVYTGVIVLGMMTIALLLASFGIAWVLGDLLGERWYGFMMLAALYLIAAFVILRLKPRMAGGLRARWREEKLERSPEPTESDQ